MQAKVVTVSVGVLLLLAGCPATVDIDDDDVSGDDDTADDDDTGDDDTGDDDDTGTPPDDVPPSSDPPGGLLVEEVPLFVSIGFDDNYDSGLPGSGGTGGMTWAIDMCRERTNPDGSPVLVSFYNTTLNLEWSALLKHAWRTAYDDGHEIANHTHNHPLGGDFSVDEWLDEIETCEDWLTAPYDPDETEPDPSTGVGIPLEEIVGFRTPYLDYNDATFEALDELGYTYDCSIIEGFELDEDGTTLTWPYTFDDPAGLWELPLHVFIVPPDELCEDYGVPSGLRDRLHDVYPSFDPDDGKILGMDYMFWVEYEMTGAEVEATLLYSFDLRMQGNRAPMMLGGHSAEYSSLYTAAPNATLEERQDAIEVFLDHALSHPEVRVVPMIDIVDWMRDPTPL